VGRRVAELPRRGRGRVRAGLSGASRLRAVRRSTGVVPSHIAGDIHGGGRGARRNLAVAVNGRIEAVGRSWHLRGRGGEHFAVMVPEDSLREGGNTVEVFQVGRGRVLRLLARVANGP
jgi:hypothetical protein